MRIEITDSCLSDDHLQQLVQGTLLPNQVAEIESHVSSCQRCRDLLESSSIDGHWSNDLLPALRAFRVERLDISHDEEPTDSFLELLGPTDDPEMLGRIAEYEVVGVIGRGGMGVVFKAFDRSLHRYVAIKMLLPHLAMTGAARKRFEREGQAAAAVIDDHVAPIYAVAQWQGVPYLVTQYLRGNTVQKLIHDTGPLALRDILRVGMQTALGLAAAHAQGLVHRDVKPSNILLDGSVSRAMLTDFGLARAVDDASITRTGIISGTPQYMSPEQARGGIIDARSDLFGLGCVLYAMCTGRPPFHADNSYAILRMITDDEPRSIRDINPDIPEWLCNIIRTLMAKSAADRFESASAVATLLEQCLAHVNAPTRNSLPHDHVMFRSSLVKRLWPIMSDKRILSLCAFTLLIAAVLLPWSIAAVGRVEFALSFAGTAALLSCVLALLSRAEYFSRLVLWCFGLTIGLAVVGICVSMPIKVYREQSSAAQAEFVARMQADVAAKQQRILADSLSQQANAKLEPSRDDGKGATESSGQENASPSPSVAPEHVDEKQNARQ